jgi:hypothetical protein
MRGRVGKQLERRGRRDKENNIMLCPVGASAELGRREVFAVV